MIYPIILCGGIGSRLWPVSRKSFPKQFVQLIGEKSLFQQAFERVSGPMFEHPILITSEDYRFIVAQQIKEISQSHHDILLEPTPKNTAPAAIIASCFVNNLDPDALVLLMPSDHLIENNDSFEKMILNATPLAEEGRLVIFGVAPDRPETGYGYFKIDAPNDVIGFVEKPDLDTANKMVVSGNYFWNSGIFFGKAKTFIRLAKKYEPSLLEGSKKIVATLKSDLDFLRMSEKEWKKLRTTSIDKAIIEKNDSLSASQFLGAWSDLGDWNSVKKFKDRVSKSENILIGKVSQVEVQDSLIISNQDGPTVGVAGLQNIAVIATSDAVLVADMAKTQLVGKLVKKLKGDKYTAAEEHRKDYRPWGWFESLVMSDRYQVKRLCIYPGKRLSLQSHKYRSEHWVVTEGKATVEINDKVFNLESNQSCYIECGEKHRLTNDTREQLIIIEIQTGSYLGEDDIIRYEDDFQRC